MSLTTKSKRQNRKGVEQMISKTFMEIYFWGAYIWFAVGFVIIAVPAIMEIKRIIVGDKRGKAA